jgi:hypothetical protein
MGADPPISGALFRVRRPFDLKWAVRLGGRPFHEMGGVITRAVILAVEVTTAESVSSSLLLSTTRESYNSHRRKKNWKCTSHHSFIFLSTLSALLLYHDTATDDER